LTFNDILHIMYYIISNTLIVERGVFIGKLSGMGSQTQKKGNIH